MLTCSKLISTVIIVSFFVGCSPPRKVAVDERITIDRNIEIDQIGGALIRYVQPGDTLHGIAFIAGLNVKDVAAWNEIADVQNITIGQRIRLTKPIGFVAREPEPVVSSSSINVDSSNQKVSPTELPKKPLPTTLQSMVSVWHWPVEGEVLRQFSQANGQQGIDISAQTGDIVIATNAGEVVYVGNSLKGYGNLVIVQHNEIYLSAYANNDEIFVREGEQIKAQQRIASVGINRHNETALHFQIRKNGQPLNPLLFLSKAG